MRSFGLEISANIQTPRGNRKELTTEERAAIVSARKAGVPRNELAKTFRCDVSTITRTIKRFQQHDALESKPRNGRPKKLNRQKKR